MVAWICCTVAPLPCSKKKCKPNRKGLKWNSTDNDIDDINSNTCNKSSSNKDAVSNGYNFL